MVSFPAHESVWKDFFFFSMYFDLGLLKQNRRVNAVKLNIYNHCTH